MASSMHLHPAAVALASIAGCLAIAGCTIKIENGTNDGADQSATGEDDTAVPGGTDTLEEHAAEVYSQIDPHELAVASAKAGFATSYLVGATEELGLDPTALDEGTLHELLQQFAPLAEEEAGRWLATVDPSTLELSFSVKFECGREGCKNGIACEYLPPSADHICYTDDCGSAKCRNCPDWVAERLKGLVWKTWCSYVCIEFNTSPPRIVATGAGAVSAFGGYFVGPLCFPQ